MGLALEGIDKIVGRDTHLAGIDLAFEPGSRNVILGRTLAGKTSLLRIMAGLDRPTRGRILVDGQDVTGISVRKRNVAMVYQQFINYPSLNVYKNIASPLKLADMDKKEIDRRVRDTAAMLRIDGLLDRLPAELSGGQQQRIAIARSLVKNANLLLLDEPLANLDYKLREELREELQDIFREREAIVVYTTTEPTEALMLGGHIVVLDEGRILQTGATTGVYHSPATLRVAEVFSDPPINYIGARVKGNVAEAGRNVRVPLLDHMQGLPEGSCLFGVRAHHLFLSKTGDRDVEIKAVVELSEINGSETFIHVRHAGTPLVVHETGIHSRKIGQEIAIYVDPANLFVYDEAGQLVASPAGSRSNRQ
ncbi:MAG: ABC transporter ATP-binding protein [Desulfobacterales bacterium]